MGYVPKIIAYFTQWGVYGRQYFPSEIPTTVDTVSYCFVDVTENAEVVGLDDYADYENQMDSGLPWAHPDRGNFGQMRLQQAKHPHQVYQLALCGWTKSVNFGPALRFPKKLADNILKYIDDPMHIKVDGTPLFTSIAIDYEYLTGTGDTSFNSLNKVSKDDYKNYMKFLSILHPETQKRGITLNMCISASIAKLDYDLPPVVEYLDELVIMTYDMADGRYTVGQGQKPPVTAGHAALYHSKDFYMEYSADAITQHCLSIGIPSHKIYIGAACYSRGFQGTDGYGKTFLRGRPSLDMTWEKGIVDYKDLPLDGLVEQVDEQAGVAYTYDSKRRVLNTYDNPKTVEMKADYVMKHKLGGLVFWELSADNVEDPGRSLIQTAYDTFQKAKLPQTPSVDVSEPLSESETDSEKHVPDVIQEPKEELDDKKEEEQDVPLDDIDAMFQEIQEGLKNMSQYLSSVDKAQAGAMLNDIVRGLDMMCDRVKDMRQEYKKE